MSIARAQAKHPPLVLADEPTTPPDSERSLAVARNFKQQAVQHHAATIVVTHDRKTMPAFACVHHNRDGPTVEEAGQGL